MNMDKIEQFLFDIMGLLVPGFLFLFVPLIVLVIGYDYSLLSKIASIGNVKQLLYHTSPKNNYAYIFLIITTLSYLFGHIVKVLSIRYYDFLKKIFDDNINIGLKNSFTKKKDKTDNSYNINFFSSIITGLKKGVCNLFDNFIIKLFKFKTKDYDDSSKEYRDKLIEYLKEKEVIPDKDLDKYNYPIYKLSCIIQDNNGIKTLVHVFLAKYNLYRSLSFIAIINVFFILYLLLFKHVTHKTAILYMLCLVLLFYYTFHYKYKRYWMLSGNEAIMGLYYYYFLRK